MLRVVTSPSGAVRRAAAQDFARSFPPAREVLLVGATRAAVDDLARELARERGATFGLHRLSFTRLAGEIAALPLARQGLAPAGSLGGEAGVARALFTLVAQGRLGRLADVARSPGLPRALAGTLRDLRQAGVSAAQLDALETTGPELARLLSAFEDQLSLASAVDLAGLFTLAARHAAAYVAGRPLLLFDVPVSTAAQRELVAALAAAAPDSLATAPSDDARTLASLATVTAERDERPPLGDGSLARLSRFLFAGEEPPAGEADGEVLFFSAPGEGRECMEIARRALQEAAAGVPFDRMAVFLRSPAAYAASLESAFAAAAIPAYFSQGTTRPDPAGRAFLALLLCRAEDFSARRFAEYLSLGQVPRPDASGAPPTGRRSWAPPRDEAFGRDLEPEPLTAEEPQRAADAGDAPVVDGVLRAPWRWEELLVEAAVIGGHARWKRRLDGLDNELGTRLSELSSEEEPDSSRALALKREREDLGHLRRFALPVIERLTALPGAAPWREWLAALATLAPMVLRDPLRVLSVLAELQPLSVVGPVELTEVYAVLADRLTALDVDPPRSRYGRLYVGSAANARGLVFDVVFVPGLAERVFPERPREDPMLLDTLRARLSAALDTQPERVRVERTLLRLAVGAAARRLVLSYPRLDLADAQSARARVPSFYALDVARAIKGTLPDVSALQREAEEAAGARLSWPAPEDPARALSELEYDLAVLQRVAALPAPARRARARYLLALNTHLSRALRSRWRRWRPGWSPADGLVRTTEALQPVLAAHALTARPYSATALQRFAVCPYQFLLGSVHRLEPRREAVPLIQMDPLTRGQMFHVLLRDLMRALKSGGHLPLSPERLTAAQSVLDEVLARVAAEHYELLAPAIERLWQDEVTAMRGDARHLLADMAAETDGWVPAHFELAFGLPEDRGYDEKSVRDPVRLPNGWRLRGAVDLLERKQDGSALRVSDYKTGRCYQQVGVMVGGGEVLQPVLYGLAAEAALGTPVAESRLLYCTERGGHQKRTVSLANRLARHYAEETLATVEDWLARGFLPPAPRHRACQICDFREVCGQEEWKRLRYKELHQLEKLEELRTYP